MKFCCDRLPLLCLFVLFVFTGCSDQSNIPSVPGLVEDTGTQSITGPIHHNLGQYNISIRPETQEIEFLPLRAGLLHLNATSILNSTMGVSAQGVPAEHDPPNGIFTFDVTLTHPFGTKPQFSGFDVKGILMTPGTLSIDGFDFAGLDEPRLLNADGFTRWWNPTEFTESGFYGYTDGNLAPTPPNELTALINPFKYFADVLDATSTLAPVHSTPLDADGGRGLFSNTSANTRRYRIKFPMNPGPQINFGYAVDAAWAPPDVNPPVELPDDFPINANQPEPYDIETGPILNTLFYDSESGHSGGVLFMTSHIYDWQGQLNNNVTDEINLVRYYSPDLFAGYFDPPLAIESPTHSTFQKDLTDDVSISQAGPHLFFTRVESADGSTYDQGTGAPSPTDVLTPWQVTEITVEDPPCEADANNDIATAVDIELNEGLTDYLCFGTDQEDWYRFDAPLSSKLTGSISLYIDADARNVSLTESDGSLIVQGYAQSANHLIIDLDPLNLHPGEYYIKVDATMVTPAGPGALVYYLYTDMQAVDITPTSPLDVTPMGLSCEADWIAHFSGWNITTGINGACSYEFGDPHPVLLSSIQDDGFCRPVFNYPYLFYWENFTGPGGIDMIDYTDMANPVHYEDVITTPDSVEALAMRETWLYVAHDNGSNTFVNIYDLSTDPANPDLINSFLVLHNITKMELIGTTGDHALVAITLDAMAFYDVSDPLSVIPKDISLNAVDSINMDFTSWATIVIKTVVDGNLDGWLSSYFYTNDAGLTYHDTIVITGYGRHIDARSGHVYVSMAGNGISIIDIFPPGSLGVVGYIPTSSKSGHISIEGSMLANLQTSFGFSVFVISDPVNPVMASYTECLNYPLDGVINDEYGYFVEGYLDSYGALKILDLTDPSAATLENTFEFSETVNHIATNGSVLAVTTDYSNDIWFYDLTSDPVWPGQYHDTTLPSRVRSMVMTDKALYICLDTGLMKVFDIENPPYVIAKPDWLIPFGHDTHDMEFYSNHLYISSAVTEIIIVVDVTSEYAPNHLLQISFDAEARDISISDGYMYFATGDRLRIVSLADPSQPEFIGMISTSYSPNVRYVASEDYYAFVSDYTQSPLAVYAWPPDAPSELGQVFGTGVGTWNHGLIAKDGYLYELKEQAGLRIYDLY